MECTKSKGPGYLDIFDRHDDVLYELELAFLAGKSAPWPVLQPAFMHRVWEQFSRTGHADESALDAIYASMRDNLLRLQIATAVAGHASEQPQDILEQCTEQVDAFCAWLIETPEGWRISDYGINPLTDAIALAFEAKTQAARLKYLDRALHVCHMRGDLSRLFVQGGRRAIDLPELETA